jgi:hypothetical protein
MAGDANVGFGKKVNRITGFPIMNKILLILKNLVNPV